MKKIVLFCAGGMSTSLLVNKMKEAAAAEGREYDISAHGLASAETYGPNADVILLGPQVRYALNDLKKKFPGKPIDSIEMQAYGTMNGKKVLAKAVELMGDK